MSAGNRREADVRANKPKASSLLKFRDRQVPLKKTLECETWRQIPIPESADIGEGRLNQAFYAAQ